MTTFLIYLQALLLLLVSPTLCGQVPNSSHAALASYLPKENSGLNYRIVGFSVPNEPKATIYTFEIASGNYYSEDSFTNNRVISINNKHNKTIAEVPFFGKDYTWRVIYKRGKSILTKGGLHHFSTQITPRVDTSQLRMNILQPAKQDKDEYVSVESGGVLYDMAGNPVWFIPKKNGIDGYVGNLRFTPEGTVTFLYYKTAYEINFNGDILWESPDRDIITGDTASESYYHHEFIKCGNGHYMVLGSQQLKCKTVSSEDTSYVLVSNNLKERNGYRIANFGVIIEYDRKGKVVWSWQSSTYLLGSDFDYFNPVDSTIRFDPHDNSFFFDEKNKFIYLGFRNLNRVIKIGYPSGRVLRAYGENFKPGTAGIGSGLFCNQHGVCLSREGYLCYFNNNSCNNTDSVPTIEMLEEPEKPNGNLREIWEFPCPVERDIPLKFSRGGNLIELPDRSLFVCMGGNYSKMFIVDRQKKIRWAAIPEKKEQDGKWKALQAYRGFIITRKALERLIWNGEK